MQITSPVFENMGRIPDEYTCQGDDTNPPLEFSQIPEGAQSLVLIVEDPDAPSGTWDHWILFNIDAQTTAIAPNSVPSAAYQVFNSFGRIEYGGPCPPEGEEHRYYFKLYALDQLLATDGTIVDKPSLITAMNGHILAQGELVGLYSRD
ncbi:YbhB/YbcL family Raf kinase inhibitor-like protein [candidate division WWE3 bacterium]|uniref:YbhB/YbcL family Raf kinase inhibitor-like protein n=1 Tax=candidate division WWE3 bacterium TaxID=2053526 RepID=A0A955LKH2_UNCKA|nr:YbhB/YbcL family Raf kinase inhibitor-like protein [candidate division WWE3 bacterium]